MCVCTTCFSEIFENSFGVRLSVSTCAVNGTNTEITTLLTDRFSRNETGLGLIFILGLAVYKRTVQARSRRRCSGLQEDVVCC